MKYKCKTRCFGFRGQYWNINDVVDVKESEMGKFPERYFIKVVGVLQDAPVEEEQPVALSQIGEKASSTPRGFATSMKDDSPTLDKRTLKPKVVRKPRKTKKK